MMSLILAAAAVAQTRALTALCHVPTAPRRVANLESDPELPTSVRRDRVDLRAVPRKPLTTIHTCVWESVVGNDPATHGRSGES